MIITPVLESPSWSTGWIFMDAELRDQVVGALGEYGLDLRTSSSGFGDTTTPNTCEVLFSLCVASSSLLPMSVMEASVTEPISENESKESCLRMTSRWMWTGSGVTPLPEELLIFPLFHVLKIHRSITVNLEREK